MKIAVVTETFFPFRGGSARRYQEVFKRIAKAGHEVHIYTARLRRDWPLTEEIDGMVVHRSKDAYPNYITKEGFRSLREVLGYALWSLLEPLKEGPFDLVEANHCPVFPTIASWLHARMRRTPLSVTFHEVWHNEWYRYVSNRILAPVGIDLEYTTTRLPDLAIAVSETTARGLVKYFGMPQSKIRIISNGVNPWMFEQSHVTRDPSRVVFVGRLNPHKKLEWLLKATENLSAEHPDLRVHVVGDGPMAASYRSYVSSNGLSKRVKFLGALDDDAVAGELRSSAVYVLPSIREGQSITVLEAMAAGTPQVVVDATGSAAGRVLEASESGMTVSPNPKAIAGAIGSILDDPRLWRTFSDNGLKFISRFSWDRIADDHLDAYRDLVHSHR